MLTVNLSLGNVIDGHAIGPEAKGLAGTND